MPPPHHHLWHRRATRPHFITITLLLLLPALILTVHFHRHPPSTVGSPSPIPLTAVHNSLSLGAVCLDGTAPHYHLDPGFGSGADSWLLHIEGGGWCTTTESCAARARTPLGSSRFMEAVVFYGILSRVSSENPDFYNWNRVKVRYCDGASFYGDVEGEVQNGTKLFFRGKRIWEAVMSDLLLKGLAGAKKAFLTGCSAGGLATFLHCDRFHELLPNVGTVKCLADAGFFLDEKDVSGRLTMQSHYTDVVRLQSVEKSLKKDCLATGTPTQCFFPHEIIRHIATPLFILNPAYDYWQIQNVLAPDSSDPQQHWLRCKQNIHNCDPNQIQLLQVFRTSMLNTLKDFQNNKQGGMYINSCFIHCQTLNNITWHSPESPRVNNKTIAEAVGDWFFDRRKVKVVDCAYPCNPTCYHVNFDGV